MTIEDIIGLPEKFDGIDERFDDLAASTQREFVDLRAEMRDMQSNILRAIENVDLHLSSYVSVLDDRITRLEKRRN